MNAVPPNVVLIFDVLLFSPLKIVRRVCFKHNSSSTTNVVGLHLGTVLFSFSR